MPKLEVLENKKLVLNNVLKKELRSINMGDLDKELMNFTKKLELLKVQTFGPLIIKNYGASILDDGSVVTDYDLIVQAHDYKQYKNEFMIEDKHECHHCIYVHFEGKPEYLAYAHSKLDLYFYENDILDSGTGYTVCLQENDEYVEVDVFRQVLKI